MFPNEKDYISASEASDKIGYSSDYIGQLCRAKKVPGRLIGRTWYVDLNALEDHKRNRRLGKPRKRENLGGANFLGTEVFSYEKDERPLLPVLIKRKRSLGLHRHINDAVVALGLIVMITGSAFALELTGLNTAAVIENPVLNKANLEVVPAEPEFVPVENPFGPYDN